MEQFRISRALGLSFRCWVRNFIPFTLLAAVLQAPLLIWLATLEIDVRSSAPQWLDQYAAYRGYIETAISTIVAPLATYRIIQELDGAKVSMWRSFRYGLRGLPPAILFALALHLLGRVPYAGPLVGTIAMCVYFVAMPAAVAERLGPFASFSRAAELTRGRRWRIYGQMLLLGVVILAAGLIWMAPRLEQGFARAMTLVSSSITFNALLGLFYLYYGIVQAVTYALLRQDKDGMTHAELARVFE
jgi:hypothetical protein